MKVGIFDSGVGGLTVLKAVRSMFPRLDIVYVGDTARVPYGNRSPQRVVRYSLECARFLMDKGVEVLVVACNTASSYAVDTLKTTLGIPVLGVVEPGVKKAIEETSGRVGVIGTTATIRSGAYQRELIKRGIEVFSKACPLFVPLVEEGLLEGEITRRVVDMYLRELRSSGIDTLILGCTHYPLLKKEIGDYMRGVKIIDSSDAVAQALESMVRDEGNASTELFFTDESQNLTYLVELILGSKFEPQIVSQLVCSP